jgi:hypothetical protein
MIIDADGHFPPNLQSDNQGLQEWLADYHNYNRRKFPMGSGQAVVCHGLGVIRQRP